MVGRPRYNTIQANGSCRPHVLKTSQQHNTLMREWKISSVMGRDRLKKLAARLSIPKRTIYKWFWDRNRGYLAAKFRKVKKEA